MSSLNKGEALTGSQDADAVIRAAVAEPRSDEDVRELAARVGHARLQGLARLSSFHGVAGYVYRALGDADVVSAAEREMLAAVRTRVVMTHLAVLQELEVVGGAFEEEGIPWVVIKGPVLAERIHGSVELRGYTDLDVVVPPTRLADAVAALEGRGAVTLDRNWELLHGTVKGELHVRMPAGITLDLHWHLLNSRRLRDEFTIDLRGIFDRVRSVHVGERLVPTMSSADSIVYVALHAMLSGGHRLVWLKDLERLLVREDWVTDDVQIIAESWGASLALHTALSRAGRIIGSSPGARSIRIRPRTGHLWAWIDDAACRLAPVEQEDGSGSLGRLVARSVRPTLRASLTEGSRRTVSFLRDRRNDVLPVERTSHDPQNPGSVLFPTGDEATKRAYFESVVREAKRIGNCV